MPRWLKDFLHKMSPQRWIFVYYLLALSAATLLLSFPLFHRGDKETQLIDVTFVAASALSVTGLTTVDIAETFNTGGYIMIMLIMNLGGIGIMALGTLIRMFVGFRIGLHARVLSMVDNHQIKLYVDVRLVVGIFKTLILIEITVAFIYVIYFMAQGGGIVHSLMTGVFLSVSATTNAGMDLFGNSLLDYTESYFLQFVVMLQIM